MAVLYSALSLLLLAAFASAAPLPVAKYPATAKYPAVSRKVPRKVLPVARITAACASRDQNPPYKVVNCNVKNPFKVAICVQLACTATVPGACPTGPGAAGSSNEACAWNVKPPGAPGIPPESGPILSNATSMYPVQPGETWNFGWSTTDPAKVVCAPVGPGFARLAPGMYTC